MPNLCDKNVGHHAPLKENERSCALVNAAKIVCRKDAQCNTEQSP